MSTGFTTEDLKHVITADGATFPKISEGEHAHAAQQRKTGHRLRRTDSGSEHFRGLLSAPGGYHHVLPVAYAFLAGGKSAFTGTDGNGWLLAPQEPVRVT